MNKGIGKHQIWYIKENGIPIRMTLTKEKQTYEHSKYDLFHISIKVSHTRALITKKNYYLSLFVI